MITDKSLPKGFITIDEAIALVDKHTMAEPTTNLAMLLRGKRFIRLTENMTIPVWKKGENGKYGQTGEVFIRFDSQLDIERWKDVLSRKYREIVGRELDDNPVTGINFDNEVGGWVGAQIEDENSRKDEIITSGIRETNV